VTATSLHLERFTLDTFHEFTPSMVGASRAALFACLPTSTQLRGLQELDERIRARSDRLWEDSR
jgi:hypothetical protein